MTLRKAIGSALKAFGEGIAEAPPASGKTRQDLGSLMQSENSWFSRGDAPPWTKEGSVQAPYAEAPIIHRCVKVLSDIVSGIPLEFFRGDSDEPLPLSDPIARVFANPNAHYSGRQLISRLVMDELLYGNGLWFLDGMAGLSAKERAIKFPTSIIPLPAAGLAVRRDPVSRAHTGWIIARPMARKEFSLEETVHFFLENPHDDYLGMSEVAPAKLDYDSMNAAATQNIRLLRKGGPGTILTRNDPGGAMFGGEGDSDILSAFNEGFQGEDDRNAIILPPGMTPNRDGATQREMDFEKLLRFSRENQAGALGVPPSLIGILEYANYSNMGSQLEYVYHFAAFPLADRIQDTIQTKMLDRFGTGARCYFKKEAVRALFENLDQLTTIAARLWGIGFTREAINERLELGFDLSDDPTAEVSFLPAGMAPAEAPSPEEPAAKPKAAPPAGEMEKEIPEELKQKLALRREAKRAAKWASYVKETDKAERIILGDWRAFLAWLRDESLARIGAQSFRGSASESFVPPDGEVAKKGREAAEKGLRRAIVSGQKSVIAEVGLDIDTWSLLDPEVTKLVNARSIPIVGASEAAAERMRKTISEGVKKGETIPEIAERIRVKYGEEYAGQATVVARTEALAGFSWAREGAKTDAGIERHEWLSARDESVRDSHRMDGEIVKLGEPFSNGLFYPMDPDGPPEEVIQCRCVAVSILD